jgi:hypothetical protein
MPTEKSANMHGEVVVVMQSHLNRPDVLSHSKRPTEIAMFLDRLGTWALLLALAVGGVIVLAWLTESLT